MSDAPGKPEKPAVPGPFEAPLAGTFRCPSCGAPAAEGVSACIHCGSLLATRRCVACFTLNPREADRCTHCGALLPKESLTPVPAASCPECHVPLVARTAGVIGFSECARCGGLFLRPGTFEAVEADIDARGRMRLVEVGASKPVPSSARFHYRECPVCRSLMNRINYAGVSGVVVDVCRKDGIWFDRGELTAIVEFLERGGYEKAKHRERERLRDEVRDLQNQRTAGTGGAFVHDEWQSTRWGWGIAVALRILADVFLRR